MKRANKIMYTETNSQKASSILPLKINFVRMETISIIFFLLISIYSIGQDNDLKKEYTNNTIYVTVGSAGITGGANINYERNILRIDNRFLSSLWLKVGGGIWWNWADLGSQYTVSAVGLSGRGNNHFEYSLGVTGLYNGFCYDLGNIDYNAGLRSTKPTKWDYTDVFPIGSLGYRYQKPNGHFVFRTGFVIPEPALYISLGLVF